MTAAQVRRWSPAFLMGMRKERGYRFDDPVPGSVRFLTGIPHVRLGEDGKRTQTVTLLRTGRWNHPRYGEFEIDKPFLQDLVRNFEADTYGQEIFLDVAHKPDDGAAAKLTRVFVEGNRLRAEAEFTDFGLEAIKRRGFKYLSAEFHHNYEDKETGEKKGPVLFGGGLVTRPFVKRMDPIDPNRLELSDADGEGVDAVILHPQLANQLSEEAHTIMNKFLKRLKEKLQALKLHENVTNEVVKAFEATAKTLGEDEAKLEALTGTYEQLGQQLSEQIGNEDRSVTINLADPASAAGGGGQDGPKALTADDITKMLDEREAARAEERRKAQESLEGNQKTFTDALAAAEGLSDETRKKLTEQGLELVTGDMTAEQVKKFAEHQISVGNELEAAKKLSDMGFSHQPGGRVSVSPVGGSEGTQLQAIVDEQFKRTNQYAMGRLALADPDKLHPFASMVLGMFDELNGARIHAEHKVLAAGETNIGSTDLPVSVQRSVIREALQDLRVLDLVQTLTDMGAQATTQIPYELRKTDTIFNDGIVYEGQEIDYAGVEQKMDLAYINAMKIAMLLSNEVMHFSRNGRIDWDAWARNVASNSRLMRELIVRRICNQLQRAADAYGATDVTGENIAALLDGSNHTIRLANFPLVRPHQPKDLQGNNTGTAEHTITVAFGATPVEQYDGTGTQSAGTYYRVTNYNLGYIQFVDESGSAVTPSEATATVDYSYATNVAKFDLDVPSGTLESRHLNGLMRAIGARKAVLSSDRFVMAEYLLMSPVLNDIATNAEQFAAQGQRSGADTDAQGDLERVKGIPSFGTNAPDVDLGDERIVMGSRGQLTYTVSKPVTMTEPFQAVGTNGKPVGQLQSYGEEYNAIHVPSPIRGRMTSVIAYSVTDRAAVAGP